MGGKSRDAVAPDRDKLVVSRDTMFQVRVVYHKSPQTHTHQGFHKSVGYFQKVRMVMGGGPSDLPPLLTYRVI